MTMAGAVSAKFDDAVICVSGFGGPYIGGSYTGVTPKKRTFIPLGELGSDVQVQICHIRRQHATEYDGFTLEVLVAPTNESTGFGIRYEPDVAHMDLGRLLVAQTYKILVKFPNDEAKYQVTVEDVNGHAELPEPLRVLPRLSSLRVDLLDGGEFTIEGFGLPFANPGHDSEDWLNRFKPIIGGLDLLSLLRRRSLTFLVPTRSKAVAITKAATYAPFTFPYDYPFGATEFDIESVADTIIANPGPHFAPAFRFDDDQQMTVSSAMASIQDIFWLHKASSEILEAVHPAYFVTESEDENPPNHLKPATFAIIRLSEAFRDQFKDQWARLTKDNLVGIQIHLEDREDLEFVGIIMDRADTIPCLGDRHSLLGQFEFDLVVRFIVDGQDRQVFKTFQSRAEAEEAMNDREGQ